MSSHASLKPFESCQVSPWVNLGNSSIPGTNTQRFWKVPQRWRLKTLLYGFLLSLLSQPQFRCLPHLHHTPPQSLAVLFSTSSQAFHFSSQITPHWRPIKTQMRKPWYQASTSWVRKMESLSASLTNLAGWKSPPSSKRPGFKNSVREESRKL